MQIHLPKLFIQARSLTNQAIIDYPQISDALRNVQSNLENISTELIKDLTTFGTSIVTSSFGVISSAISGIFKTVIAVIFAFYILMSKEKLTKNQRF